MDFNLGDQVLIFTGILLFVFISFVISYIMKGLLLQEVAKSQRRDNYTFAWIPILNNYLLIEVTGGNKMALISYGLGFIPFMGSIFSFLFLTYTYYLTYKLLTRYNINSLMIIIGFFIWPILFICYFKAYKNVKNNKNYYKIGL